MGLRPKPPCFAPGCGRSTDRATIKGRSRWERYTPTSPSKNTVDRGVFDRGHGAEADIRRSTVDGIVDTGAVTLVLPQNVVERLGLEQQGTAFVTYADERRDERPLAGPVTVRIGNRAMVTNCVVGPPLSEPLIGQVVLETLDLLADCTNRTLTPRYPDYPLLKLKAVGKRR